MKPDIKSLSDVVEGRLCTGCGACAALAPEQIKMAETVDENRRPVIQKPLPKKKAQSLLSHCPGAGNMPSPPATNIADSAWGPVLEVWEGYAANYDIRFKGSSGGAVTALALFAIEQQGFAGALHVKASKEDPTLNVAALSTNRTELMEGCGSRYAPASVADRLDLIEEAETECVVIGKPCDIGGANAAAMLVPSIREKLGLTISIFCAGTPSHKGTDALLKVLAPSEPGRLAQLDYRGEGWPGEMRARWLLEGQQETKKISYKQGWGEILQKHRQWRCHTCADHTGEYADISVGDPWQTPLDEDGVGRSLIVVRTERGRAFLRQIQNAGYLFLEKKDPSVLFDAQPNLFQTKGAVWGRSKALELHRLPAPKSSQASFRCWLKLSLKAKAQSFLGTAKRVRSKQLDKPKKTRWLLESQSL